MSAEVKDKSAVVKVIKSTAGEGITANAAYEPAYTPNPGLVGKIFFTLALLGIAGYMYFRKV